MYQVVKVINNNIVSSTNEKGTEIILRGLGLGFKTVPGDKIDESKVEKIYTITNHETSDKLQELLSQLPLEYVQVCTEIIDYAKSQLNVELNDNIYVTLTDHISFAIERKNKCLEYKNALLAEIQRFYNDEYRIGLHALEIVNNRLNIKLSTDEAGFIALHIVNAELGTVMTDTYIITDLINAIVKIVEDYYDVKLDVNTLYYDRFIIHLKYFMQKLFDSQATSDDEESIIDVIKNTYEKDYKCALKIKNYVELKYNKIISDEELSYLTVHLRRLTKK